MLMFWPWRSLLAAIFATGMILGCSPSVQTLEEAPSEPSPVNPVNADPVVPDPVVADPPTRYGVVDEFSKFRYWIDGDQYFRDRPLPSGKIQTSPMKLLQVLRNTRHYFEQFQESDPVIQRPGVLASQGVTLEDVLQTLDFMILTLTEDISQKRPMRLQDGDFINEHFRVIQWLPYQPKTENSQAQQRRQQLRLTNYAIFTHPGSRQKTGTYNVALYALPNGDETELFYKQYTKQDVLQGIYEPGGKEAGRVKPLAYLTRAAFEDALMQGTILINFTDGTSSFFNVDRNNGIAFVRGVDPYQQKRYWYFRPVEAIKGYGSHIDNKINIEPEVTFAGDVFNMGLGRVVLLEDQRRGQRIFRLGVIADTGGAFIPNLYQLDFLTGTFPTYQAYQSYARQLPDYVGAYILIKK
ncbi:hypothetical protein L3556_10580 [Candidatus Synechococcus calcipolaris G9]|uniref:POLO box domain-containing protein n=1 Tax=Candidatus Synechococcus calcipolaris G9 TaxID=1497997 RepID=A0ABT6F0M1_9SYNE|nr:hypothetical protein [Candidatus Synechococcus calcipolaris]MDG2991372.1 hypothetical protein [Candidatus Synechococcus calcipolaris G9]